MSTEDVITSAVMGLLSRVTTAFLLICSEDYPLITVETGRSRRKITTERDAPLAEHTREMCHPYFTNISQSLPSRNHKSTAGPEALMLDLSWNNRDYIVRHSFLTWRKFDLRSRRAFPIRKRVFFWGWIPERSNQSRWKRSLRLIPY